MSRLACLDGISDEQFVALKNKFGDIVFYAPEICVVLLDSLDVKESDEPRGDRSPSSFVV